MKSGKDDTLKIEVTGKGDFIPVDSFLEIIENTLKILRDVDASVSQSESATLDWQIVEASFNSPLMFAIAGQAGAESDQIHDVLRAYVKGIEQIEKGADVIPEYFTHDAVRRTKELASVMNDGIAKVTFRIPSTDAVIVTRHAIEHADSLISLQNTEEEPSVTIKAKTTPREEEGTILVGRLETLTVHGGKPAFYIYDPLTGEKITCYFTEDKMAQAKAALDAHPHRVSVTGTARYNRAGRPTSIDVESFTPLRERHELPQMRDLEGIDLTGGVDPTEYIRRLRDG